MEFDEFLVPKISIPKILGIRILESDFWGPRKSRNSTVAEQLESGVADCRIGGHAGGARKTDGSVVVWESVDRRGSRRVVAGVSPALSTFRSIAGIPIEMLDQTESTELRAADGRRCPLAGSRRVPPWGDMCPISPKRGRNASDE
eukprot:gene17946-biopygen421